MLRILSALVCLAGLTACGLKGPLYMPEPSPGPDAAPQSLMQSVPQDAAAMPSAAVSPTEETVPASQDR